jgi:hypothetical protein
MLNVISTAVLVLALLPLSASGQTAPTAAAKPGGPAPTLKRVEKQGSECTFRSCS